MAVTNDDKFDLLLLVDGEELQKLIQTLLEQPTDYKSHIEKLDHHFKANRNNTLELNKLLYKKTLQETALRSQQRSRGLQRRGPQGGSARAKCLQHL